MTLRSYLQAVRPQTRSMLLCIWFTAAPLLFGQTNEAQTLPAPVAHGELLRIVRATRVDRAPKLDGTLDDRHGNRRPLLVTSCNGNRTKASRPRSPLKYVCSIRSTPCISGSHVTTRIPGGSSTRNCVVMLPNIWTTTSKLLSTRRTTAVTPMSSKLTHWNAT